MDPTKKIPHSVHPEKKPVVAVEADIQEHSTTQAVVAMTKVLDDGNLLREIIVRVGFPTTLVRAALVCKRWLVHASDPKFLIRFRKLHPPHLLGYYIYEESGSFEEKDTTRFVPMLPQPPELATVIRRLESYNFGAHDIMDCRNGTVLTKCLEDEIWTRGVHRPLCPEKGVQIAPPLPLAWEHNLMKLCALASKEEGSSLSYLYVSGESTEVAGKSMVHWCVYICCKMDSGACILQPRASMICIVG